MSTDVVAESQDPNASSLDAVNVSHDNTTQIDSVESTQQVATQCIESPSSSIEGKVDASLDTSDGRASGDTSAKRTHQDMTTTSSVVTSDATLATPPPTKIAKQDEIVEGGDQAKQQQQQQPAPPPKPKVPKTWRNVTGNDVLTPNSWVNLFKHMLLEAFDEQIEAAKVRGDPKIPVNPFEASSLIETFVEPPADLTFDQEMVIKTIVNNFFIIGKLSTSKNATRPWRGFNLQIRRPVNNLMQTDYMQILLNDVEQPFGSFGLDPGMNLTEDESKLYRAGAYSVEQYIAEGREISDKRTMSVMFSKHPDMVELMAMTDWMACFVWFHALQKEGKLPAGCKRPSFFIAGQHKTGYNKYNLKCGEKEDALYLKLEADLRTDAMMKRFKEEEKKVRPRQVSCAIFKPIPSDDPSAKPSFELMPDWKTTFVAPNSDAIKAGGATLWNISALVKFYQIQDAGKHWSTSFAASAVYVIGPSSSNQMSRDDSSHQQNTGPAYIPDAYE